MSSNLERSSSLPPYAAPAAHELAALSTAPAASYLPFVPPTWVGDMVAVQAREARESAYAHVAEQVSEQVAEQVAEQVTEQVTMQAAAQATVHESRPAELQARLLESSDESLPWIEAFAVDSEDDGFAASHTAVDDTERVFAEEAIAATEVSAATEAMVSEGTENQPVGETAEPGEADAAPEPDATDDTWAMHEASADIAQLADELSALSADASPAAVTPAEEPHGPWQEDEAWMDIMPTLPNSGGRDLAAETEWARAFGEPPAPMQPPPLPTGDAQAAAASLESIARRLRAGDLNVPGFHANRGDAAALAAALAALLGANDQ